MKLIAVLEQFDHHNLTTSPDNMINYIDYDVTVRPVKKLPENPKLRALRQDMDARLKKHSGMTGYETPSVITEAKVLLHTLGGKSLVHFYNGDTNCKYFPFVKGRNVLLTTYHQPPDFFYNFFSKCSHIEKMDAVLVTSTVQIDMFRKYLSDDRIIYSPLAVDVDLFQPAVQKKKNSDKKICLFVGNWLRDFETMREVLLKLESRSDIEFHIITLDYNRHYFEGLSNVKFYTGVPLDFYMDELHSADLFMVPYLSCTSNLAILESMAVGLPIVTTDVGGIRDYVDEGFATLLKKGDHQALADAVVGLLDDPATREEMSAKARAHAMKFSWQVISENVKNIYRKMGATVS